MSKRIAKIYKRLTGHPYYTGRSMVEDFGPPPRAVRRKRAELVERPRVEVPR